MIVTFIGLGWREGIVVAAAVPLTLAAVFFIMLMRGRVFDRITLGVLILGWSRVRAAGYAWSHTAAPMLAGTLVTVIRPMAVGFARSTAGEYTGNIFWVMGFALLAWCIVAVTFTPSRRADAARHQGPAGRPCSHLCNARLRETPPA